MISSSAGRPHSGQSCPPSSAEKLEGKLQRSFVFFISNNKKIQADESVLINAHVSSRVRRSGQGEDLGTVRVSAVLDGKAAGYTAGVMIPLPVRRSSARRSVFLGREKSPV